MRNNVFTYYVDPRTRSLYKASHGSGRLCWNDLVGEVVGRVFIPRMRITDLFDHEVMDPFCYVQRVLHHAEHDIFIRDLVDIPQRPPEYYSATIYELEERRRNIEKLLFVS